jgi:hypothetical protein
MATNIQFELDRLRVILLNKGLNEGAVQKIIQKAESEIHSKLSPILDSALEKAVAAGVDKKSEDFINELRIVQAQSLFFVSTDSGQTDFSTPPFPMLPRLIAGGKPSKDGTSVYRVIPVGASNKPSVSTNIFDAQKRIHAERVESAQRQYAQISPKGSKANFRTASSRQNAATQWVIPGQEKDFTEDLRSINDEIQSSAEDIIREVIRDFEEGY